MFIYRMAIHIFQFNNIMKMFNMNAAAPSNVLKCLYNFSFCLHLIYGNTFINAFALNKYLIVLQS